MIRYRCRACGVKLESPASLAGKADRCPACQSVCAVPVSSRRPGKRAWLLLTCGAAAIVIGVMVVLGGLWRPEATQLADTTTIQQPAGTRTAPKPSPPAFTVLEERDGMEAFHGLYGWYLIEPMTEPEVRALGQALIDRMHERKGDHLKAWLFYSRGDYRADRRAIWLGATSPDYELRISGPIPKDRTPRACFDAWVKDSPLVGFKSEAAGINAEYHQKEATVVCHDRWVGQWPRLCVPVIVAWMFEAGSYLAGNTFACIPGLKRVEVRFYEGKNVKPVATVSFDRTAVEDGCRLNRRLWDQRAKLSELERRAAKRYRAKVMSKSELRAIQDQIAQQIYQLYEDDWVAVSPHLVIKFNRSLSTEAPRGRLRKYFFGWP